MNLAASLIRGKPRGGNSKIVAICGSTACPALVMLFPEEATASCRPIHCPYLRRIGISHNVQLEIYRDSLIDGCGCENSVFLITPEKMGMQAAEGDGYEPCIRKIRHAIQPSYAIP